MNAKDMKKLIEGLDYQLYLISRCDYTLCEKIDRIIDVNSHYRKTLVVLHFNNMLSTQQLNFLRKRFKTIKRKYMDMI